MWASPGLLLWGILWVIVWKGHLSPAFGEGQENVLESLTVSSKVHSKICEHNGFQKARPHTVSILEFGAVGDGKTLNTHAFENAIFYLRSFADKGGAQLYVPPGQWLTGSFSLTSHLTLFIDQGAVILGTQDITKWPIIDSLPSYGRGRELPGDRHCSLIYGENLTDVVITGENGTVDGQGSVWWDLYRNHSLDYTRPHLVEFINSDGILFSNLTFRNSPFWNLHPVYCSNVVFQDLTILAPHYSPNTDGIDPDSCTNVCIKDSYIDVGDDAISIKSGWDEYGISYGKPSANILIQNIHSVTPTSAGIAIGSEMSGGVQNVTVENMVIRDARSGFRIKTAAGRGGYIRNVYLDHIVMQNVSTAFAFTGAYGGHPDDKYDPEAYPIVENIVIKNVVGDLIQEAGTLFGIKEAPFRNICLSQITLDVCGPFKWNCTDVEGIYSNVFPEPCPQFLNDSKQVDIVCSSGYITYGGSLLDEVK
ncbi:hypothetical protein R1sor_022479 [Riccia sorocarpa]|uniref:Polygalacturonase n=1 Tax=Riccia sorocarpa TaxID=122646 RepID=A0ABD3GKN8_9MARC